MGTCGTVDDADVGRLAELELFAGADRERLHAVTGRSTVIDVDKGRELVRQGSDAREFVVILDGRAVVSVDDAAIAHLGPGSCFGEMSLIDGTRRHASVTAATPMRVVVFSRDSFFALLTDEPSFSMSVLAMLVGRLRMANAQLADRAAAGPGSPSPVSGPARSVPAGGGGTGPASARRRERARPVGAAAARGAVTICPVVRRGELARDRDA